MGLPYSKFFWGDYLKDTRMLSLEAKGAWMDILCHLSQLDEPGEAGYKIQSWARLLGVGKRVARRVIDEIGEAKVGKVWEKNELIFVANSRIKNDFFKFTEKQIQASEAGKLGAEKRHNPLGINESPLASAKKGSSEKSSESRSEKDGDRLAISESINHKPYNNNNNKGSSEAEIPTLEEVLEQAKIAGVTKEAATAFWNWVEGENRWINSHGKMINWRVKMRSWQVNDRKYQGNGKAGFEPIPFGRS
jgi:uncharacterized protein YdaU (DUF1376 family)